MKKEIKVLGIHNYPMGSGIFRTPVPREDIIDIEVNRGETFAQVLPRIGVKYPNLDTVLVDDFIARCAELKAQDDDGNEIPMMGAVVNNETDDLLYFSMYVG